MLFSGVAYRKLWTSRLHGCQILHKFTVDLPKKHGRGGQSALRFARLRMEKRHNYVRKVSQITYRSTPSAAH